MEKIVQPYEILFRFGESGALLGGHYQTITLYSDPDGDAPPPKLGDAQPIAVSGNPGVPLAEILSLAQTAAIAGTNEARAAEIAALAQVKLLREQNLGLTKANTDLTTKLAQADARTAQISEYNTDLTARLADALNKLGVTS